MQPIRTFYQLQWRIESPLLLGAEDDFHDKVSICYSSENPYIPGSSLAGAFTRRMSQREANHLFKGITQENEEAFRSSNVIVSDAIMENRPNYLTRDGIKLGENKRIVVGAKYDVKALQPNQTFVSYIEVLNGADYEKIIGYVERLLHTLEVNGLEMGSKTTRGYGEIQLEKVGKTVFYPKDFNQFITFNPYDLRQSYIGYRNAEVYDSESMMDVVMKLKLKSGLAIRKYETGNEIGYLESNNKPMIPGTSIAGVLRHYCESLSDDATHLEKMRLLFGSSEKDVMMKSKLIVRDSYIEQATIKQNTRIKINRISGGSEDGALFSEKYVEKGSFTIQMKLPKSETWFNEYLKVFSVDINDGFVTFGGAAGIGRGMCQVEQLLIDGHNVELTKASNPDA